ncbi:MAG TPA: VTC domain-containing protein [Polyangiaceae bacterium]
MNGSSLVSDADAPDAAITAERAELKYLVLPERLPALLRTIATRLAAHRFTGEAANRLPGAEHHVTTIYFDTPSRAYFTAARANRHSHVKLRAKEYYDLHPALAELATDPEQILHHQPWLWFELKRREGLITSKRRFRFPKAAAASLFRERERDVALPGDAAELAEARALIDHVRAQSESIAPSAVVNYRRSSFQNADSTLRVTVDLGLAYFAVPSDVFERARPLARGELGRPLGVERRAVVEVKRLLPEPEWLRQALVEAAGGAASFSKFIAASEAAYGA